VKLALFIIPHLTAVLAAIIVFDGRLPASLNSIYMRLLYIFFLHTTEIIRKTKIIIIDQVLFTIARRIDLLLYICGWSLFVVL